MGRWRQHILGLVAGLSIIGVGTLPSSASAAPSVDHEPGSNSSLVITPQGALRGMVDRAAGYRVFKGIPYAQPPGWELAVGRAGAC
jgi:hypothetical protein